MTTPKIPIGKVESETLEFKGRDILQNREKVAREVVAFLNREGGELWIGLAEEDSRAVKAEPIQNVDQEIDKIVNSLLDRIEPRPTREVQVEAVSVSDGQGGSIIRVRVQRGRLKPYAVKRKGAWREFVTRVGRRTAPMSREELRDLFRESGTEDQARERVIHKMWEELKELLEKEEDCFWMRLQPVREIEINIQDPAVTELLLDRELIGVDPTSPSFHVPEAPELGSGIQLRAGERVLSYQFSGERVKETRIRADGGIIFESFLQFLYRYPGGSTPRQINPAVLLGVPASLLRLAAKLWEGKLEPQDPVLVDLALLGAGRDGAVLRPGRFDPYAVRPGFAWTEKYRLDTEDLIFLRPLEIEFESLQREPDRVAFRLIRGVYEAFGLPEEAIPMSFDREGRLLVPA